MGEIKIRKRTLPPRGSYGPRTPSSKALLALQPGQSFTEPYQRRATLAVLCTRYGRQLGRQFVTRRLGDAVLVYRVA